MLFVNDEVARKRELINFNESNIIIVEDLFGRSNIDFNEDLHRGILDVIHFSLKSESCKSKVIFTIRGNNKIKQKLVENHNIFQNDIFLNLDEALSFQCKKMILSKHMHKHGLSLCDCDNTTSLSLIFTPRIIPLCSKDVFETKDNSLKVCVAFFNNVCRGIYDIHIGFPQACHLFCSNKYLTKQGRTYFNHTSQSLVDEMNHLKIQGFNDKHKQCQYCVLVYTAMKNSISFSEIDEECFQNILSSVYDECNKFKVSLLKAAVLVLEGTYISNKSAISAREKCMLPNITMNYALQHYTIQDAVLISYGEDADVLTFCDLDFLLEYIRTKGYIDKHNDNIVLMFTDYKPLVKKLISMLSVDEQDNTYNIGMYLQLISLLHRHDDIIRCFFHNIENVTSKQYKCLINGLTSFGKNRKFIEFHPKLCRGIMIHAGLSVFLSYFRQIGWVHNDTNFFEMETDKLINTLFEFFSRIDENGRVTEMKFTKYMHCFALWDLGARNPRYAIGNYVFQIVIEKGFVNIAELIFTNLMQNTSQMSPIDLKDFLDGLLDEGKRSSFVAQFKDFFDALLFKYGSIPAILELCRPLTATLPSQNTIVVDDDLLAGNSQPILNRQLKSDVIYKCQHHMSLVKMGYTLFSGMTITLKGILLLTLPFMF